jgi:dihydroorotate dehydrogenase electron transfer subunit
MKQALVPLVETRSLGPGMWLHVYRDAEIASSARPGQFLNVRVAAATAPLLRRPLSILNADPDAETFSVYFKAVGEGTELLARAQSGESVDVVGPLGEPFRWQGRQKALLVGGGVGIAPLYFLASQIEQAKQAGKNGPHIVFAYGSRDEAGLALANEIGACVDELLIATEDGARGQHGLVTALLDPYLDERREVFCCGPTPMMAAVLAMMRKREHEAGWFSLENQMGCAVGVCMGCVIETRKGYQRVCCDGPVFPAGILDF